MPLKQFLSTGPNETNFAEIRRHNHHGYTAIVYQCSKCQKKLELPVVQNISYCPHCGRKIAHLLVQARSPRPMQLTTQ